MKGNLILKKIKKIIDKYKFLFSDMILNMVGFGIYVVSQKIILLPIIAKQVNDNIYTSLTLFMSILNIFCNVTGGELGNVRLIKNNDYKDKKVENANLTGGNRTYMEAVNNEIGSIQPIEAISELLADKPTISFHVDAVQALAKIPTEKYLTDRVDFATFSSHKFHGVRGVGFVYIKSGKKITPLLTGGGQERDYRSTTENVAGIAATAKALRLSMEKLDIFTSKTGQMKAVIHQALLDYPDIFVFSDEEDFAPHILTFGIKGVRGEVIVHAFEDYDIFISTTSACSSKAGKPAGTLIAMGVDKDKAQSAVRLSLDLENDMSQVEQFLTKLKLIYNQTKKVR